MIILCDDYYDDGWLAGLAKKKISLKIGNDLEKYSYITHTHTHNNTCHHCLNFFFFVDCIVITCSYKQFFLHQISIT